MAHFQIILKDSFNSISITHFETYSQAQEYWDRKTDTPYCESGELLDLDNGEVIWEFGEKF